MTRYPKSGKGKKWTALELKAVPLAWRGDMLSDGDGLTGEVRVVGDQTISIHFKFAFKWNGKVAWHYCGTWPAMSMEQIRRQRDEARDLVRSGVNPNDQKKAERIENQAAVEATIAQAAAEASQNKPFKDMFDAWLADGVARKDGNAELRRSFEKDVLPVLGEKPVRSITEHDLRKVLRTMVARGVNRMSVRVHQDLVQLFAWAEKRQPWRGLLIEGNPADLIEIRKIVSKDFDMVNERDRVLTARELQELQAIFERMEADYEETPAGHKYEVPRPLKRETQLAIWICLGTLCRIGELLMTRWEHVDLVERYWTIPVENVKGPMGKKQGHRVYLSDFSLRQFRALKVLTGTSPYCFPARNHKEGTHIDVKTVSKQVGDRQIQFKVRKDLSRRANDNALVLKSGSHREWTPHDMRRTGATMMQALGILADIIDRCQNHVMAGSRVRRHYLHHEFADEKKAAWEKLGQRIDAILAQDNTSTPVVPT